MHRPVQLSIPDHTWDWFRTNLTPAAQEIVLDTLQGLEKTPVPEPVCIGTAREVDMTLELEVLDGVRALFSLDRRTSPAQLTLREWCLGSND